MKNLRLLVGFIVLASVVPAAASAERFSIVHITVIDTETGVLQPNMTVTVEGNRIVGVAASMKNNPSTGRIIEGKGEYLIPGLWDMHTHVFFGRTAPQGTELILPLFLANGVTGIRDMGSNLDAVLKARAGVAAHKVFGPRMVVAGPMLDGPKSHYEAAIPITTPEQGRAAVDMLKSRGVDFIKVQSGVPREAYFAIAKEAKQDGIDFEGHVPDSIRASEAVAAGQRSFEHLIGIFEASSPADVETGYLTDPNKLPGKFLASYNPKREAAIIKLLAKHHVWQCPTLFWERGQWLVDATDVKKDPDLAYAAHSWVTKQWPASVKSIESSMDTDPLDVREQFVAHELDIVQKLHRAGVPFLAGTDTPAGVDLIPGISLHLELQRLVAAGFTPLEALQTATINPALFFGTRKDYGTVETGKIADLVLLKANPLVDIANTRSIAGVFFDGQYLSAAELARLDIQLKRRAAMQ